MALPYEVDDLGKVPENARTMYVKDGDVYRANVDMGESKLMRALQSERQLREQAEREARAARKENDHAAGNQSSRERELAAELQATREAADRFRTTLLDAKVAAAAAAAGLHQQAIADAVRAAREAYQLDDQGELVRRDGKSTALVEWFEESKETSPHWFPAMRPGSGAQPSNGLARANVVSRGVFEQLSPGERGAFIGRGGRIVD